jgi:DNA replicative helicase MCM subunit Mcm2 (Cdc46/Mcm family)
LRIATIAAVFRGSKVVEIEDLDWAIKVVRHSTAQIAHGLQKHMLEDYEQADLVEHIRELCRKKTVVRLGEIRKHCERKTGDYRKIDAAIHHLVTCEEIIEAEAPEGPGRPTKRWRWNA